MAKATTEIFKQYLIFNSTIDQQLVRVGSSRFSIPVARLGAIVSSSAVTAEANEAMRGASLEAEAAYSGVNLDVEAANLIEQQQAYRFCSYPVNGS